MMLKNKEIMYKNVERKIKGYVTICTMIIIVCCAIMSLMAMSNDGGVFVALALLFLCIGVWIGGLFLYGFAELLEQSKLQSQLLIDIRKIIKNQQVEETNNEM